MNKRAFYPVLLLLVTGSFFTAQAQQERIGNVQSELSMVWGFAQGSFGDNVDRPIPGILFSFGGESPTLPLVFKTEFGWMNYGFDDHLELRLTDAPNPGAPPISVVNVEMGNSILMTHLVARVVPLQGKIKPYVDGMIGFKYLVTRINLESEAIFDDDELIAIVDDDRIFTSSTFDSFALSYGGGAGIDVEVFNGPLGMHNKQTTITMHLGVRYLFGTDADYLTGDSILADTDGIRFEQVTSDTDMIIPELGLQIGL